MKKTRLIIVPITSLKGHAALTLIRKFGKGETRRIPVDYKPSKTELPTGLDEDEVMILGWNGRLAKLALKEGISLPRVMARFITKNEDNATVKRFLKKVEKVLSSTAATTNFQKSVKHLLKTFEPAVAVRAVTGSLERIFSQGSQEVAENQYTVDTFGSIKVARVKKEVTDPFVSALILEKGKADIVLQNTVSGPQISRKPAAAGIAREITHQVRRQGMLLGDGSAPTKTGNTLSFTTKVVMENKTFPTFEHVCQKTEEVCTNWSTVSAEDVALVTVE